MEAWTTETRGRRKRRRLVRSAVAGAFATALTVAAAPAASAAGPTSLPPPAGWEVASAGRLNASAHLSSITSAGPFAAWAVGHHNAGGGRPAGVVMRWDGWEWRVDDAPGLPQVRYWKSVSAVSPHDVWAYGWGGPDGEVIAHYDGRSWRRVTTPDAPPHYGEVAAVPGRTFLSGDQRLSTYARGSWQTTTLPRGVMMSGMDARSARDAWAVGGFSLVGPEPDRPVAMRWDGREWREVPLPAEWSSLWLAQVHVESPHSVYVSARDNAADGATRLLHWDGHAWHDITGPVEGIHPAALEGDGLGSVWFSGDPAGWEGPPVLWRYRHGQWTRSEGATVDDGATQSYEITDLAPLGRTGLMWAAGEYDLLTGPGRAERYDLIEHSTYVAR